MGDQGVRDDQEFYSDPKYRPKFRLINWRYVCHLLMSTSQRKTLRDIN